jgi:hypothetical protein
MIDSRILWFIQHGGGGRVFTRTTFVEGRKGFPEDERLGSMLSVAWISFVSQLLIIHMVKDS